MPRPLAQVIPSTFLLCSGSPFPQQLFYARLPSHHLIPQPSTPNLKTSCYIVRGLPRQQRRSPRPGQTLAPFIFLHFVPCISSIPVSPAHILPFPGEQTGQAVQGKGSCLHPALCCWETAVHSAGQPSCRPLCSSFPVPAQIYLPSHQFILMVYIFVLEDIIFLFCNLPVRWGFLCFLFICVSPVLRKVPGMWQIISVC